MSRLRRTFPNRDNSPCPQNGTAYLLIYNAVRHQRGLIHGQLDNVHGEHCAIGSYFADQPHCCLNESMIDEVAMVNDSVPTASLVQRKRVVQRWLRWKLATLGLMSPLYAQQGPTVKAKK